MKTGWILASVMLTGGCLAPRHSDYVLEEMPPEYFAGLPDVPVPSSPYSDPDQTRWFGVGYREGYRNGMAPGIHVFPRYPLHPACQTNQHLWSAQTNGFERGNAAGFAASQVELDRVFDDMKRKINANNTSDGIRQPADGSPKPSR
jgi:hypothetical protein